VSRCRSCGAPIQWAITEGGKRMPVDLEPSPIGNIALYSRGEDAPIAIVITETEIEAWKKSGSRKQRLFLSHFTTCPQAKKWRRS